MAGHWSDKPDNPGLREAVQAKRKRRQGKPTEADKPRPSTFKGRKVKVLPGQLDVDGNEH